MDNLEIACPQGITITAGEWGLGDGSTFCVTATSEDSFGNPTYVVLTANITQEAAIEAAASIHVALLKANESYQEPV